MEETEKFSLARKYIEAILSSHVNLTGLTSPQEAWHLLYRDSVLAVRREDLGESFLDVGTGGGVPGVFLAIEFGVPGLLVDSVCKKVNFVELTCRELGIENVRTLCARAEELKDLGDYVEKFDAAVSRALSALPVVLELTTPYVKVGGRILVYKGPAFEEELEKAVNAMRELQLRLVDVRRYHVLDRQRVLLIFQKLGKTPDKYPRRSGIPQKRPL